MTDETDEQLLTRLRGIAARVGAPPAHVDEAAQAAFSTRHLDLLARLLMDSETGTPVLARGAPDEIRLLSFAAGPVSVELQVASSGQTVTIRGLVLGATGPVTIEMPSGRRTAHPDEHGWFTEHDLPAGMSRLRLRTADGTAVTTEWVDL